MAYGVIDLIHPKGRDEVLTGRFYTKRSETGKNGVLFRYEMVDATEWHFQKLLGNIISNDGATLTIKTCNDLQFINNGDFGYCLLQDGRTYKISSVTDDIRETPKQALRTFKTSAFTDHVLRLIEIDEAWSN